MQSGTRSMATRALASIARCLCPAARPFCVALQTQRTQARGFVQLGLAFFEVFGHGFLAFALLLLLLEHRLGTALVRIAVLLEAASLMRIATQ
jgi:hypothetical protein